jgi:hypothetical protein
MSRAYRIKVRETLTRDIRAEDSIQTRIELLEVLPPERMAELLTKELEARGFEPQEDGTLVRVRDGARVTVEPCTGEVTIAAEAEKTIQLEGTREGYGYDDLGPTRRTIQERLTGEVKADLEKRADQSAARLQTEATQKLEKQLADMQPEMAQVVHRVTAEALKEKAAQMGQVREVHEDPNSGSLTIRVEV